MIRIIAHLCLQEEVGKAEGLISYQKVVSSAAEDRQQLFVTFSDADLKARGLRFSRGDMVEFMLSSDPETGRQTASQVTSGSHLIRSPPSTPRALLPLINDKIAACQLGCVGQLLLHTTSGMLCMGCHRSIQGCLPASASF